jgi:AbrB family looped-hinge helix DNA binding protein
MADTYEYKVEDIFHDIENDPDNVMMTIPEEIREKIGLVPGDTVRILWGDKGTVIITKVEENAEEQ